MTLPDSLAFLGGGALGSLWVDGNPKLAWGGVCDTLTDKGVVVVHDAAPRRRAFPTIAVFAHSNVANYGHTLLDVGLPLATLGRRVRPETFFAAQHWTFRDVLDDLLDASVVSADAWPPFGGGGAPPKAPVPLVALPPRSAAGVFHAGEVDAFRRAAHGKLRGPDLPPLAPTHVTFVTRGACPTVDRVLTNEPLLVHALKARCASLDVPFRVADLALLKPRDQVAVFASSRVVVGLHGAGLANALFCVPGAVLIELASFWDLHEKLCAAARVTYVGLGADDAGYAAHVAADVPRVVAAAVAALDATSTKP